MVPTLSRPDCAMSQHELHVSTQTQSRPRMLGHDMGTSRPVQCLSRQRILYLDRIPPSHAQLYCVGIPVAHSCLSCAPDFVLGDIAPMSWLALSRPKNPLSRHKFSLPWPTLLQHRIALSRHNFSLPWPTLLLPKNTQSRQKIFLAWPTMSRHRISLSQHKTSPFGHTLLRHKIFCCNIKYSVAIENFWPSQLIRDIKILGRNRKPSVLTILFCDNKSFIAT